MCWANFYFVYIIFNGVWVGWGGVGWGFNEEQDLQQALVLGRCLVM